jgi:hypothetical protein
MAARSGQPRPHGTPGQPPQPTRQANGKRCGAPVVAAPPGITASTAVASTPVSCRPTVTTPLPVALISAGRSTAAELMIVRRR